MANELELFRCSLEAKADNFAAVIGTEAETKRFIQSAIAVVGAHPEWLGSEYDRASLFTSCMHAAQSTLSLDPNLGHVYFVPRRNKKTGKKHIQFQAGYKGLLALAYKSGQVDSFQAEVVREGDAFDFELGTQGFIHHKPAFKNGNVTHVWAQAHTKAGGDVFVVIPVSEVDKARKFSDSGSSDFSPWAKHYDEMARKTALRRLAKLLNLCVELQRVVGIEEQNETEWHRDNAPKGAAESIKERLLKNVTAEPAASEQSAHLHDGGTNGKVAGESRSLITDQQQDDLSFDDKLIPDA
jgi:recombination protein RecT